MRKTRIFSRHWSVAISRSMLRHLSSTRSQIKICSECWRQTRCKYLFAMSHKMTFLVLLVVLLRVSVSSPRMYFVEIRSMAGGIAASYEEKLRSVFGENLFGILTTWLIKPRPHIQVMSNGCFSTTLERECLHRSYSLCWIQLKHTLFCVWDMVSRSWTDMLKNSSKQKQRGSVLVEKGRHTTSSACTCGLECKRIRKM